MANININLGGLKLDLGFDIGRDEIAAILSVVLSAESDSRKRRDILDMARTVFQATPIVAEVEETGELDDSGHEHRPVDSVDELLGGTGTEGMRG